jgi:hypothetical protein
MSGMRPGLLARLRKILLECGAFASDTEMRTCFVDARLDTWRHQLPEAHSPAQRVDAVIAFLYDKQSPHQENALILLLRVLAERKGPADACHQALLKLARTLEDTPGAYTNLVDEINQRDPNQEPPPTTEVIARDRGIAAGKRVTIKGPVFQGDIYGNVTQILKDMPAWLRYLLWSILGISFITLLGVVLLLSDVQLLPPPSVTPAPILPKSSQFALIDASVNVRGLRYQDTEGEGKLWAIDETTLYQLELPLQGGIRLEPIYSIDGPIVTFAIDCQGNIWFALTHGKIHIYNPQTATNDTWLDAETVDWLAENTIQAIETRCLDDGSVEVWLAHEGVHTLRYRQPYPTLENIALYSDERDWFYSLTSSYADIVDLYLDADNLWGIDRVQKILFRLPFNELDAFEVQEIADVALWSLTESPSHILWVAGEKYLTRIGDPTSKVTLNNTAYTVAAGKDEQIWLGGACSIVITDDDKKTSVTSEIPSCWPLSQYVGDTMQYVPLNRVREVLAMVIDNQGIVWIGTDQGLICYPKELCES